MCRARVRVFFVHTILLPLLALTSLCQIHVVDSFLHIHPSSSSSSSSVSVSVSAPRNVNVKNHHRLSQRSLLPVPMAARTQLLASTSTSASESESASQAAPWSSNSMKGCVCVVTGASRGIGKGIAIELGKAGAIVYITGTSSSERARDGDGDSSSFVTNEVVGGPASETVEETAREVNEAGGVGIPVYCDHSQDEQVQKLFERIQKEQGRLDLLVNNVFRIPPSGTDGLFGKFWEIGVDAWDYIHTVGCRSHYVASCYAVPIMKNNSPNARGNMKRPMIAMISSFGGLTYTFNVAYGVGKAAVDRLAKDMAVELREEDIAVTSFYPGLVMTERTQRTVESGEWDKNVGLPVENAETPRYTGRGVIAVATDQDDGTDSMAKTGTFQVIAELAKEYGFTDENGRQPPSIRSLKFLLPAYGLDEETREKVPDWLIPDWKLPFFIMAQGAPPVKADE